MTDEGPAATVPRLRLRLLETTDVHANLLAFDYYADDGQTSYGLVRTAALIRQARAEAENCLLLDNGDFLQGTPVSDLTAQTGSGWRGPHPSVMAMNHLRYDAATLGNHEFNFGLDWLGTALAGAAFPIVCANVLDRRKAAAGAAEGEGTLYPPCVILERRCRDDAGTVHDLRIGLLGVLPPQITIWDHSHLAERVEVRDIVETARRHVPELRRQGADLVVVLAHTGIDPEPHYPMQENAALGLGEVEGVDAILAGHTHEAFPVPGRAAVGGADHAAGTFNGTPGVMAGFRGSHLGVLDLWLERAGNRWQVTSHRSEARPVAPQGRTPAPPDEDLRKRLWPVHRHTLKLIDNPLGRSTAPLHSYLSLVRNDPATQLVTRAQRAAIRRMVHGTADAGLPILSASAPFKTGGRAGPFYYSDVPQGDLRLRNAVDLYAFPNRLCALRLTGAELRDWLERAAVCFNRIRPGDRDQMLGDPAVPGHNFDIIDGLTYAIDLSQPARYDRNGRLVDARACRISDLRHEGRPVEDDAEFLLAANSFRAHGGGPYPQFSEASFAVNSRISIRNVLAQYIRDEGVVSPRAMPVFSFVPLPGTSVVYETGPGVRKYPAELAALGADDLGDSDAGFARLRLTLG